jgi:2-dehydropantoate 2-reductase
MRDLRIAVLGTGAQGASVGADLVRAGLDVTFIDQWTAHVEAMRADGVQVNVSGEAQTTDVTALHLYEICEQRKPFDVVLVAVKAYDTRWACELIVPALHPRSLVVGMQNGMTMDAMAQIVGSERTIGAVVEIAANMWEPGIINRETPRSETWFSVGAHDEGRQAAEETVVALLQHAGSTRVSDDIRSSKWMKLVVNAAEGLPSSILGLSVIEASNVPGIRDVMTSAGDEAIRAGLALGYRSVPILDTPVDVDAEPAAYARRLLDRVLSHYNSPSTKFAVLQDWLKGRRGEVDDVSGLVAREQTRLGGEARVNGRLVAVAHRIERGELSPEPDNVTMLVASTAAPVPG